MLLWWWRREWKGGGVRANLGSTKYKPVPLGWSEEKNVWDFVRFSSTAINYLLSVWKNRIRRLNISREWTSGWKTFCHKVYILCYYGLESQHSYSSFTTQEILQWHDSLWLQHWMGLDLRFWFPSSWNASWNIMTHFILLSSGQGELATCGALQSSFKENPPFLFILSWGFLFVLTWVTHPSPKQFLCSAAGVSGLSLSHLRYYWFSRRSPRPLGPTGCSKILQKHQPVRCPQIVFEGQRLGQSCHKIAFQTTEFWYLCFNQQPHDAGPDCCSTPLNKLLKYCIVYWLTTY